MSECPRAARLFGGCRFRPRFDISEGDSNWSGSAAGVVAAIEASKRKTYVHDVCERCGKTIERPQISGKQ